MEWLNYHHLLYFHVVAKEGSIARATKVLNLTQPTISAQLRALEESLGEKLFEKSGRKLVLTEIGKVVNRYAEEIFALGLEMRETVRGRPTARPARLIVGLADVIPKLVAFRLLEPAFRMTPRNEVVIREDSPARLLASLAVHELDVVISDAPAGSIKAFNHLLGESSVTFFAKDAAPLRRHFPNSLDGAPVLLPAAGTELRTLLDHFFETNDIKPEVVGEFDDSALMNIAGKAGLGAFPGPAGLAREHGVHSIGTLHDVRERFYVITPERRIKHPAVIAISERGRKLFV
jgi:LysR family transcriptional activator of nhaA